MYSSFSAVHGCAHACDEQQTKVNKRWRCVFIVKFLFEFVFVYGNDGNGESSSPWWSRMKEAIIDCFGGAPCKRKFYYTHPLSRSNKLLPRSASSVWTMEVASYLAYVVVPSCLFSFFYDNTCCYTAFQCMHDPYGGFWCMQQTMYFIFKRLST